VKGLAQKDANHLLTAREERPFATITDLHRRARLPVDAMLALAEAGALESLELDRRQALWQIHALSKADRPEQLVLPLDDPAPTPRLRRLTRLEIVTWDWERSQHSPRGHLLEPLRAELRAHGWPTAAEVSAMRNGQRADYAGIVICRQRPATAKDVTFMTLEDETGFVNLVLWKDVFKEFEVMARTAFFLGVTGRVQREGEVTHLVAEELWAPDVGFRPESAGSRDFH
jgi:error-prone DNA polymerase